MEHNIQIEQAIIGQILIHKESIYEIVKLIRYNDFYATAHKDIFQSIEEMFRNNEPIDVFSLSEHLRRKNKLETIGNTYYLIKCQDHIVSASHILNHCRLLKQLSIKRMAAESAAKLLADATKADTDGLEILETWRKEANDVNDQLVSGNETSWKNAATDTIFKCLQASDSVNEMIGIGGSIDKLNKRMLGYSSPDLIIIAARPACGKTTLAWQEACHIAKNGTPVGFFSYEMSIQQLIWKTISAKYKIPVDTIRRGKFDKEIKDKLMNDDLEFPDWNLYVNDNGSLSITELRAIAHSWVRNKGVKIIFIDYLQLIKTYGISKTYNSREQEVSYISGQLKALAKDLNIPVVALAQLKREAERGKAPQLKDLRESGSIEQDADVVLFIYDDDERTQSEGWNETVEFNVGKPKPIFLDIAKFRLGTPCVLQLDFDRKNSQFKEVQSYF